MEKVGPMAAFARSAVSVLKRTSQGQSKWCKELAIYSP
jgi:hypothetical protein